MMILTTVAKKSPTGSTHVFWRTGVNQCGILDVELDFTSPDSELIAELIAIQYLLFEKQVHSRYPSAGDGYKLVVSKGAIKKLAKGRSSKKDVVKFATFLSTCMQGAAIEVSQSMEFMPELSEGVETLQAGYKHPLKRPDEIDTPAIGTLQVTRHAVEQYQERISTGEPKKPWASLVKRLGNPELRVMPMDPRVARHKARKYGPDDKVEIWGHPTSKFKYVVVTDRRTDKRVLVTVFERAS